jgi:uncharacterized membrane protein
MPGVTRSSPSVLTLERAGIGGHVSDRYLAGRSAWVTGGVTGMGRAIALPLAEAGADVAIGSLPEAARQDVLVSGQNLSAGSVW